MEMMRPPSFEAQRAWERQPACRLPQRPAGRRGERPDARPRPRVPPPLAPLPARARRPQPLTSVLPGAPQVDDDPLCLKVIEQMLKRCNYHGARRAAQARCAAPPPPWPHRPTPPRPRSHDVPQRHLGAGAAAQQGDGVRPGAVGRVYAGCAPCRARGRCTAAPRGQADGQRRCCGPADMDGFKLLETVGLELDLPVISAHPAPQLHRAGSAAAVPAPGLARQCYWRLHLCARARPPLGTAPERHPHPHPHPPPPPPPPCSDVLQRRDQHRAARRDPRRGGLPHQACAHRGAAQHVAAHAAAAQGRGERRGARGGGREGGRRRGPGSRAGPGADTPRLLAAWRRQHGWLRR
jgi:hypothetical protein